MEKIAKHGVWKIFVRKQETGGVLDNERVYDLYISPDVTSGDQSP